MKKRAFLDILLILLSGLLVFCFDRNEQRNARSELNRNGLSEGSLLLKEVPKQQVLPILKKLSKSSVHDYRLQLISKDNPNFSYLYAQGKQGQKIPTVSGRFFSENDFKSEVPFVVLGQKRAQKGYQPQSQMYYFFKQRYLPVIGIAGISGNYAINQHTFISLSPLQTQWQLSTSGFRIVYDPTTPDEQQTAKVRQLFNAKKTTKLVDSSTIARERQGWFERSGILLIQIIAIILIMALVSGILVYLTISSGKDFKLAGFLRGRLFLKYLGELALRITTSLAIGFLIGWQLTRPVAILPVISLLVGYIILALGATALYLHFSTRQSSNKVQSLKRHQHD